MPDCQTVNVKADKEMKELRYVKAMLDSMLESTCHAVYPSIEKISICLVRSR